MHFISFKDRSSNIPICIQIDQKCKTIFNFKSLDKSFILKSGGDWETTL